MHLCGYMTQVSISQLWGKAWDLFKSNWAVMVGLYLLPILFRLLISRLPLDTPSSGLLISELFNSLILTPAFIRAGYLAARQGQVSLIETFNSIPLLLKLFAYFLLLNLAPIILISVGAAMSWVSISEFFEDIESYSESGEKVDAEFILKKMNRIFTSPQFILIVFGLILLLVLSFLGWAGPYAILSGRVEIMEAIPYSVSLTIRNFGSVLLAFLSYILLWILGLLSCCLGLLVVVPMYYLFMPLLYMALEGGRPSYA